MYLSFRSQVQKVALPRPVPAIWKRIEQSGASSFFFNSISENGAARPLRHTGTSCMSMDTFAGSNATPAFPAAQMMRPQLGSDPQTAVFTSGELAMERAI